MQMGKEYSLRRMGKIRVALCVALIVSLTGIGACAGNTADREKQGGETSVSREPNVKRKAKDPFLVMPEKHAPNKACAKIDAMLSDFVSGSAIGKEYRAFIEKGTDTREIWSKAAREFLRQYGEKLKHIAEADKNGASALHALRVYTQIDEKIISGKLPEFEDGAKAEEDIKQGREPQQNPQYVKAVADQDSARATLTRCLPHWPVVF